MNEGIVISASLACADFGYLRKTIEELEFAGVNMLHFDVADGSFAPTFIMGPPILASLRKYTSLPFEVHLACWNPQKFVKQFVDAGANYIAFHIETTQEPQRMIDLIRREGVEPAIALHPQSPEDIVSDECLRSVPWVLVLTVFPGFAGQPFLMETLEKIGKLSHRIQRLGFSCAIEVDGNVNEHTIPKVVDRGARMLIGGSSGLFRADRSLAISVEVMQRSALSVLERKG